MNLKIYLCPQEEKSKTSYILTCNILQQALVIFTLNISKLYCLNRNVNVTSN